MRILLTNNTLDERAGTELYLYDIARELMRRGHQPIAYSTIHGDVAASLREATVPVIHSLDQMGQPPDLIHGQHHFETMTASLYFPHVPVVNFCHGWGPPQEEPFQSPNVMTYVAVDEPCRDRLVDQFGIDPGRVQVVLNFVDTARFRPRSRLPEKPARALAFGNHFGKWKERDALEAACRNAGIPLDFAGSGSGHAIAEPEHTLARYDLVFAKARAALEAMAVGTAVILTGPRGLGPMVTAANWEQLRRWNFGVRALALPVTVKALEKQIAQYRPADAELVCGLAQAEATLTGACDRLLEVYRHALAEWQRKPACAEESQRAAARHLDRYAATYKSYGKGYGNKGHESAHAETLEVLGTLLTRVPAMACPEEVLQGYIETAVRKSGVMRVHGWAVPRDTRQRCTAVFATQNGKCAALGYIDVPRPDVSRHLGVPDPSFGFELRFPAQDDPIGIQVLLESGELLDISAFASPEARSVLDGLPGAEGIA